MNVSSSLLTISRTLHRLSDALLHTFARRPASLLSMQNMTGRSGILGALGVNMQQTHLLDRPPAFLSPCRTIIKAPLYRPPMDYQDDSFWQIMNNLKPKKNRKDKQRPLDGNPFMKGVVLKTLIRNPRKPNSGNRKCVLVRLRNGKEKLAKIPGVGHNLQEHHVVLLRCGRTQDTPGLKIKVVRGKYDCAPVVKKKSV